MFDPLHKWLGIPANEQPPHHYRLLGVTIFEDDPDVIDAAADKQLAYLHDLTNGEHGVLAEQLSNQISAARVCLLRSEKKKAYDEWLRGSQSQQPPAPAVPIPPPPPDPAKDIRPAETSFRQQWAGAPESAPLQVDVPPPPGAIPAPPDPIPAPPDPVATPTVAVGSKTATERPASSASRVRVRRKTDHPQQRGRRWWHYSAALCLLALGVIGVGLYQGRLTIDLAILEQLTGKRLIVEDANSDTKQHAKPQPRPSTSSGVSRPKLAASSQTRPQQTSIRKTEPKPPPSDPGSLGDKLHKPSEQPIVKSPLPVNIEEQLRLARELYGEQYKAAKTPSEKLAIGKKMYVEGQRLNDDPGGRFALWRVAREIVNREGGFGIALEIADQFELYYEDVDVWKLKAESLLESAPQVTTSRVKDFVENVMSVSAKCCRAEQFALAKSLCEGTRSELGPRLSKSMLADLAQSEAKIARFEQAFQRSVAARQQLASAEEDPDANQETGQYICFFRGEWDEGLDFLALGNNAKMRTAAVRELSAKQEHESASFVADAWYEIAEEIEESVARDSIRLHALFWYERAKDQAKGLERKKVDTRLAELVSVLKLETPTAANSSEIKLIGYREKTSPDSRSDFADITGRSFRIGMGARPDGRGEAQAGFELQGVKKINVSGSASHTILEVDSLSKAGFVVDYSTSEGYTKRVFLGLGLGPIRTFSESPSWGAGTQPDIVTDMGKAPSYDIDLTRWAPNAWDGRCWFTIYMQNAGANRSLVGKVSW